MTSIWMGYNVGDLCCLKSHATVWKHNDQRLLAYKTGNHDGIQIPLQLEEDF